MERVGIAIVGAGVVGLAVAYQLSNVYKNIVVIERNLSFGQEISSRNSEVIHSGIYYPENSLKAKLCVEGKHLLYEFCKKYNIPHRNLGKLIVATNDKEAGQLEYLIEQGRKNGVLDLEIISQKQITEIEPHIFGKLAIKSPSTGIVDSYNLMKCLYTIAKNQGVDIIYNTEVIEIEKKTNSYKIVVCNTQREKYNFETEILINCAGLSCDRIAKMVGINIEKEDYKLKYCKGEYFRLKNKRLQLKKLIYPVPHTNYLGIHITLDLQDEIRLGPDATYINEIDYIVDEKKRKTFYESIRRFLPGIKENDLSPDIAGIRPKLQGENELFRDFIISNEKEKDYPNFINLIGIESPGLTSSLAIAKYVEYLLK